MRTRSLLVILLLLQTLFNGIPVIAQYTQDQYDWERYGDYYPTTPRPYSDITGFFLLEGPGNRNPANWYAKSQSSTEIRIPPELKRYIVRQFKYVWFDMESFADRGSVIGGRILRTMTDVYHTEAESLKILSRGRVTVLPYFSFTTSRRDFPWYLTQRQHENWFLHRDGISDSAHRISTSDGVASFFLMNTGNAAYRTFYCRWIDSIVTRWGYDSAVSLDNMTPFPFVDSTGYHSLPTGTYGRWAKNLVLFLKELRSTLKASGHQRVKIIYNGLGVDSFPRPAWGPPYRLFGPNNGLDMMDYADGGILEGFHTTAWRNPTGGLDVILAMMEKIRKKGKIFLALTHYSRDEDRSLSSNFDLLLHPAAQRTGWVSPQGQELSYPPPSTFYRMQMSFLARFLLVTPNTQNKSFAYSFQPGTTVYQFIPFYKPWDEQIGKPLPSYVSSYKDSAGLYIREFTNCIVYVNKSTDTLIQFALPQTDQWYGYPYKQATMNNVSIQRITDRNITLQKMEGVVIFRRTRGN